MDVFEGRYFNFNRKLFDIMGLWPYGPEVRNIRKYLLLLLLFCIAVPPFISVIINFSDVDRVMLNLVIFFIAFLMFLKILALIIAEEKMKGLYKNIADDWLAITNDKEEQILVHYSNIGRKKSIFYFGFIQIGAGSIFALPTIPKILDIIKPLPELRPNIHILENELLLDREMYYWLYYFWDVFSIIAIGIVSVSVDTMFIICVEHCCAMYTIIRYRLHNLGLKIIDNSTETEDDSYNYVVGIIRLHQITLDFTATINNAFSMLFLYILVANIATIIPLEDVTVISNLDKPFNCIRFGMLLILLGVHLFMLFWPGQNVLDHGTELIDDANYNEWYTTPIRTRKIIILFLIRCTRPSLLAAGGLMLMNFETFSMIVRTAVSYITVVASFRLV